MRDLCLLLLSASVVHAGQHELQQRVASLRGLEFRQPVRYAHFERGELRAILEQKLDQRYPPRELQHMAQALAALGLLEPGYPLRAKFLELMTGQVLAFYDQHSHTLYLESGKDVSASVLAHELVHALQDQHFDLAALGLEEKGNGDRALAAAALVEGDATVVMREFAGVTSGGVGQLEADSLYLRETLLFPYLQGERFCRAIKERGHSLEELYKRPPRSTTQVLHPEKYLKDERPLEVELAGGEPLYSNVLGEFGIRLLLSKSPNPEEAAEGWRGDRYFLFGEGLVWKSCWADAQQAVEFAKALRQYWSGRARAHWRLYSMGETVILVDSASQMDMEALVRRFVGAGPQEVQ